MVHAGGGMTRMHTHTCTQVTVYDAEGNRPVAYDAVVDKRGTFTDIKTWLQVCVGVSVSVHCVGSK